MTPPLRSPMPTDVAALPMPSRPVEVHVEASRPTDPGIAVVIVTWNRRQAVGDVLAALARQTYPVGRLDVAVIDNASTDGATEFLIDRWRPDRVIDNHTPEADQPDFRPRETPTGPGNRGRFRSLTIVRNSVNHGGCGGFNTGLAFVEQRLDTPGTGCDRPAYVWLVDDDVDLPADALRRLVTTGESDPRIGLVGSRTVDFHDRATTLETTIYFDAAEGRMTPDAPAGHRLHAEHRAWAARAGGTRGPRPFTGVREVDVVSACSLLARWSAVKKVGFWDRRFFIYCDDADWCLRFGRAGYRVVCDLDAVVYHTYWIQKLTPARAYYSERNRLWMSQKVMTRDRLRRAIVRATGGMLLASRKAATHCRLFHAEILRRTVHDLVTGRGGKLNDEGPPFRPLLDCLERAGALRPGAEVLVMCSHAESIAWADDLRARLTHAMIDAGRLHLQPRWTYLVREGVPDPARDRAPANQPARVTFTPNRRSKWRVQGGWFRRPPSAVVVFDQHNDFPLIRSRWNIHVDRRRPNEAQAERDGLRLRVRFFARWGATMLRSAWHGIRVKPASGAGGKYG